MLVDLGRNDIGRVSVPGTVTVPSFARLERYSHVMHLVSAVEGRLGPGTDAFDALLACFPAGTVSGAPKVRAMEIIETLEPTRRGPYAGAVFYRGFDGSLDSAIAIRVVSLWRRARRSSSPVRESSADSDPEAELRETLGKAGARSRRSTARRRWDEDPAGGQLRLVHPGTSSSTWPSWSGRHRAAQRRGGRALARSRRVGGARHLSRPRRPLAIGGDARGHPRLRGAASGPRRVPRTPGDRRNLRRKDRARSRSHARQGLSDRARRTHGLPRPPAAVRGDALSLARGRARLRAGRPGDLRVDLGRERSWA
jgi:hypothetical protein